MQNHVLCTQFGNVAKEKISAIERKVFITVPPIVNNVDSSLPHAAVFWLLVLHETSVTQSFVVNIFCGFFDLSTTPVKAALFQRFS